MSDHIHEWAGRRQGVLRCECGVSSEQECKRGHVRESNAYRNTANAWVCRPCKNGHVRNNRANDPEPAKRRAKDAATQAYYLVKYRKQVLDVYGHKCACCGEHRYHFLTIDHVNNDGSKHRAELSGGKRNTGVALKVLRYIINHGYPDTFRILCYNCNCGRARNGGICPHEEEK